MGLFLSQLDGMPVVPSVTSAQFDPAGASQIAHIAARARLGLLQVERDANMKLGRTVADARAHLRQASAALVFVRTGSGNTDCIMLPVKTLQRALRHRPAHDRLPSELNPASGLMTIGSHAAIRRAEAAS
ncbi:hypothetical protein FHP25_36025 [Vineibacter terrae]|uniref:Uncharacterized protein n=1 Tax=Vineibacter terrae TaxID=2586908 RepID=A0A5C8P8Q8_9HYPH|nr:hypothetical protein [Vineibacter terrae]TXL70133.1 hypothetical protein FHP25_36025 [Vineibacter terrae]